MKATTLPLLVTTMAPSALAMLVCDVRADADQEASADFVGVLAEETLFGAQLFRNAFG
jgi:hypothetical protein